MNDLSWTTAIKRNRLSLPARYLLEHNLINGRVLDYGCGRGDDGYYLGQLGYDFYNYDPHWQSIKPTGKFDTVLCTYVLNVLFYEERLLVLQNIRQYMHDDSRCFISVRRDYPPRERFMVKTSSGSYQFFVELEMPIIYQNRKFCIYQLS